MAVLFVLCALVAGAVAGDLYPGVGFPGYYGAYPAGKGVYADRDYDGVADKFEGPYGYGKGYYGGAYPYYGGYGKDYYGAYPAAGYYGDRDYDGVADKFEGPFYGGKGYYGAYPAKGYYGAYPAKDGYYGAYPAKGYYGAYPAAGYYGDRDYDGVADKFEYPYGAKGYYGAYPAQGYYGAYPAGVVAPKAGVVVAKDKVGVSVGSANPITNDVFGDLPINLNNLFKKP